MTPSTPIRENWWSTQPLTFHKLPFAELHRLLLVDLLHYATKSTTLRAEAHINGVRLHCRVKGIDPRFLWGIRYQLHLPELRFVDEEPPVVPMLGYVQYRRRYSDNPVLETAFIAYQYDPQKKGCSWYRGTSSLHRETVLRFTGFPNSKQTQHCCERVEALSSKSTRNAVRHLAASWEKYRNDRTFRRVWKNLTRLIPFRCFLWDWASLHFFAT